MLGSCDNSRQPLAFSSAPRLDHLQRELLRHLASLPLHFLRARACPHRWLSIGTKAEAPALAVVGIASGKGVATYHRLTTPPPTVAIETSF